MTSSEFVAAVRALIVKINSFAQTQASLVAENTTLKSQVTSLQSQLAAAQAAALNTTAEEDQVLADLTAAVNAVAP